MRKLIRFLGPDSDHPLLSSLLAAVLMVMAATLFVWAFFWLLYFLPWPPRGL